MLILPSHAHKRMCIYSSNTVIKMIILPTPSIKKWQSGEKLQKPILTPQCRHSKVIGELRYELIACVTGHLVPR